MKIKKEIRFLYTIYSFHIFVPEKVELNFCVSFDLFDVLRLSSGVTAASIFISYSHLIY